MRVLFVVSRALELNTSASIRNRATIRGLINNRCEVDIITSKPDKSSNNYSTLSDDLKNLNINYLDLGKEEKAFNFLRRVVAAVKNNLPNSLERVLYNILFFYNDASIYDNSQGIIKFIRDIDIKDDYDLVISSSDPKSSHLFVSELFKANKLKNIPWLQIWGDPWHSDIGRSTSKKTKDIYQEEKKLLSQASKIMYVSLFTLKTQENKFKNEAHKMFWLPVPYEEEVLYINNNESGEKLTFLYAGDYSSNIRDIKPLYKSFEKSIHTLIICGASNIHLESKSNIKIYPRVSQKKVEEFTEKSDVLINLSNLKGTQIPGKLYHYSGTNKPIMFILDGNINQIYNFYKRYKRYIFTVNNQKEILNTINNIEKYIRIVDNTPIKDFHPTEIAYKILKELEQ